MIFITDCLNVVRAPSSSDNSSRVATNDYFPLIYLKSKISENSKQSPAKVMTCSLNNHY